MGEIGPEGGGRGAHDTGHGYRPASMRVCQAPAHEHSRGPIVPAVCCSTEIPNVL